MVSIAEIIGVVGGTAGLISLVILIYKTVKERPRLSFEIMDRVTFYPPHENQNFYNFSISIKFHNKGRIGTTIHSSKLFFKYGKEEFEIEDPRESSLTLEPDSSTTKNCSFYIRKDEIKNINIKDVVTNCLLTFRHTHGILKVEMPEIRENKKS